MNEIKEKIDQNGRPVHNQSEDAKFFLASIVESLNDSVVSVDFNTIITSWNKGAERLYGYQAEEVIGKTLTMLTLPEDLQQILGNIESIKHSKEVKVFETERVHKDGRHIYLSITLSPVKNDSGEIIGVSTVARDITERKQSEEALRKSQSRFNSAVAVAQLGTFEWDLRTDTVVLDERSREIFGFAANEGTHAQEIFDRIHPLDLVRVFTEAQASIQAMSHMETEYRINLPAGTVRTIVSINEAIPGADGKAERMFGVFSDITSRRRSEEALREAHKRINNILESITDCFFALDSERRFTYVNSQTEAYFNIPKEKMIGRTVTDVMPKLEGHEIWLRQEEAMKKRKPQHFETQSPTTGRWVEVHFYPTNEGLAVYFRDVTERITTEENRKQIQAETERQRRLYDTILSNTLDLVYVFDLNHRFTFANDVLLKLWGKSWDEAIGKNFLELGYEPWHAEMHDREIEQVKATKQPIRGEVPFAGTTGRRIYDYIFVPIINENGEVEAVAGTTRDVTERRLTEEKIRESEERYRTLFESIDQGFCVVELLFDENNNPIGHRILEANESFERHTGLKDVIGKIAEELVPGLEQNWNKVYAEVLTTGKSVRFDEYSEALNRWFDVYAFRVGGEESQKVGILFSDITERNQSDEKLRQQRDLISAITTSMGEGIYALDQEGRLTFMNPAAERILGWKESELLGKDMHKVIHFQKADGTLLSAEDCPLLEVLNSGKDVRDEDDVFTTHDGRIIPVAYTSSPINTNGQIVGAVLTFRDITERKQSEAALSESQEVLRLAMSGSRMGAWSRNLLTEEVYWSPELEAIFGLPTGTFSGNLGGFYDYVYEEDKAGIALEVRQAIAEHRSYIIEFRYHHANGNIRWMEGRGQAVYSADGEPTKVYGIGVDITERKRAELNAEFIADISKDLVQISTPAEIVQTVGERLNTFLGVSMCAFTEIDKIANSAIVNYEWHQADVPSLSGVYKLPDFVTPEFLQTAMTGQSIVIRDVKTDSCIVDPQSWLALNIGSHLNVPLIRNGEWRFSLCVYHKNAYNWREDEIELMRELSSRIWTRLERAFVEQEREVLLKREHAARIQAEEASRLKDEFLATVSHELRTPLNAILGWSQMLRSGEFNEDFSSRALETIYRNAKSQAQLIEDILDVSRIITGKLRINARPILLTPVIQTVVESLRPSIEAKSLRLHMSLDFEPQMIHADHDRLQQVLWNLLSNAIKFTPEKGQITIKLESGESETKIVVSDTGKGISPEFLPFVFDRFRQADGSTTRMHGGLGLGLAIVRHIVELHGGTVEVASLGEGKGTTFTVCLPLSETHSANVEETNRGNLQSNQSNQEEAPSVLQQDEVKGMRVLLVDDEKDTLELLTTVLVQNGAEVKSHTNVRDALETIKKWKPNVIISDIAMPEEDGYSLIKKLRALPPEQGGTVPAIALTAYVGIKERTQVLSSGFQMYVPKPVEASELLSALVNIA